MPLIIDFLWHSDTEKTIDRSRPSPTLPRHGVNRIVEKTYTNKSIKLSNSQTINYYIEREWNYVWGVLLNKKERQRKMLYELTIQHKNEIFRFRIVNKFISCVCQGKWNDNNNFTLFILRRFLCLCYCDFERISS